MLSIIEERRLGVSVSFQDTVALFPARKKELNTGESYGFPGPPGSLPC